MTTSLKSKVCVLVVDDEPKIVALIKEALEAHHFEVVTASSGEEALVQVQSQRLDLILLDLAMPAMDGFEVLEKLKASPETSRIPVVVVTAKGDTRSIFKARELWAWDYLVKPFDLDVLVETVKRWAKWSID